MTILDTGIKSLGRSSVLLSNLTHELIFLFIILCPLLLKSQNEAEYQYSTHIDSIHYVQFIALKDSTKTFDELYSIGNTIKEYIRGPNICRYSLGYYVDKNDAYRAANQLRLIGYTDAFIKTKAIPKKVNELPKEEIHYIDEELAINEPPETSTPTPLATNVKKEIGTAQIQPEFVEVEKGPFDLVNFSLLYTGKSFGTLGSARFQNEHELATEYALDKEVQFKLVSHACWRGYGITVFIPSDEPKGGELELILDKKEQWKEIENYPALKTNNVLLFRDPDRLHFDMLNIIMENKNTLRKYPETQSANLKIYTTEILDGRECFIVLEEHAEWPTQLDHWSIGEINRLDFGKTGRLYELPYNQGNFDTRASIIQSVDSHLSDNQKFTVKADLGHRNGYFGMTPENRVVADLKGLVRLGYEMLLPFEFELSLGSDKIVQLKEEFGELTWIASNVNNEDKSLFKSTHIIDHNDIKIGFIGMVNPEMSVNLPGEILKTLNFEDIYLSAQKGVVSGYV